MGLTAAIWVNRGNKQCTLRGVTNYGNVREKRGPFFSSVTKLWQSLVEGCQKGRLGGCFPDSITTLKEQQPCTWHPQAGNVSSVEPNLKQLPRLYNHAERAASLG